MLSPSRRKRQVWGPQGSSRPHGCWIHRVKKRLLLGRTEQRGHPWPGRSEPLVTGGVQAELACPHTREAVKD